MWGASGRSGKGNRRDKSQIRIRMRPRQQRQRCSPRRSTRNTRSEVTREIRSLRLTPEKDSWRSSHRRFLFRAPVSQIIRFSLFANTRLADLRERIDSDRTIATKITTTSISRLPKDPICDIALRFENAPIFLPQGGSASRREMISDGTHRFRGILQAISIYQI